MIHTDDCREDGVAMGGLRKRRDTSYTKESILIQTIELGRAIDNGDFVRVGGGEDEGNVHGEVNEGGVVDNGVVDMEALQGPSTYEQDPPRHPALKINSKVILLSALFSLLILSVSKLLNILISFKC